MPKTEKGKPVLFSAATLRKRTPLGIGLSYGRNNSGYAYIDLYNHGSQKYYYSNTYELMRSDGIDDFQKWVEDWCADTTEEDIIDLAAFANQPRQHVKFREGDVFRYKINRRLYGYGRILLDYALMRKKKEFILPWIRAEILFPWNRNFWKSLIKKNFIVIPLLPLNYEVFIN